MTELYLFRNALKDLVRGKKRLTAAVLIGLPTVIALLWRGLAPAGTFKPVDTYNMLESLIVIGFLLVLSALIFGTGVVSQEIEQKTIMYLLTRPVPRWRILLVKFAAAFVGVTAVVWLSTLLMALVVFGANVGDSRLGHDLLILPVGALAYGSLFLLLATLLHRPLMFGLMFAFGWEAWVPNWGGSFYKLSLMTYLRTLAIHTKTDSDTADISQFFANSAGVDPITTTMAWGVLLGVSALALLLAALVFSNREYVPREDAE